MTTNPITAVGSSAVIGSTGGTTLAVSPTAVGDCLIAISAVQSATVFISSVSGGGVTTWTNLLHAVNLGAQTACFDMWLGVVTATGSSTITFTGSASVASLGTSYFAQQFNGGASPTWSLDGATATKTNTSSATITWPTLTPVAANDLYIGGGQSALGATAGTQTAGYTMVAAGGEPRLFKVAVSGAQAPTCTNGATSTSGTMAALIMATAVPVVVQPTNINQAVKRAACY